MGGQINYATTSNYEEGLDSKGKIIYKFNELNVETIETRYFANKGSKWLCIF